MRFPDSLLQDIISFFALYLPDRPVSILLAVSGGGDSTAMTHLLVHLARRLHIGRLGIAHVHHGLRGTSADRDQAFAADLAHGYGLPVYCRKLTGKRGTGHGLEAWAREKRYAALQSLKKRHAFEYIATGHTADDQAESVVMRIMRGTGPLGACGIHPVRDDGVIRPLIMITRSRLNGWLRKEQIPFRTDPTNTDPRFTRNWVRHRLFPLILQREPGAIEHICGFGLAQSSREHTTAPVLEKWTRRFIRSRKNRGFVVDRAGLRRPVPAIDGIAAALRTAGIPFTRRHLMHLWRMRDARGREGLLPGGWRFYPHPEGIRVMPASERGKNPVKRGRLKIPGTSTAADRAVSFDTAIRKRDEISSRLHSADRYTAFLDAQKTGTRLEYRPVSDDEPFHPLGRRTTTTIGTFLRKQRCSLIDRERTICIAIPRGEAVWIPGIRIAHPFRVTDDTKSVLNISCTFRER